VKASRPTPPTASLEAAAPRTTGVGCAAPSASRTVRCAPTSTSPGTSACAAGDSSRAAATRGPEPYAALGLPRVWHDTGYRAGWLETAAKRHGVTDWHDVPRATEPPAEPFGWITRDVLEAAAADLARQEEAFEQARVPPSARAAGKAGPR
jgi:hypothetical protein